MGEIFKSWYKVISVVLRGGPGAPHNHPFPVISIYNIIDFLLDKPDIFWAFDWAWVSDLPSRHASTLICLVNSGDGTLAVQLLYLDASS